MLVFKPLYVFYNYMIYKIQSSFQDLIKYYNARGRTVQWRVAENWINVR